LRGPFEIDEARDACLREMFADAGFQAILAELPHTRFEDVDTAPALHLFDGLGPPHATIEPGWPISRPSVWPKIESRTQRLQDTTFGAGVCHPRGG